MEPEPNGSETTTNRVVSRNIRKARGYAVLSQEQLATELGVSARAVRHWENGDREPSLDTLRAISSATGLSLSFLIGEEAA